MRNLRLQCDRALADRRGAPFELVFPDGTRARYGRRSGPPRFVVRFHTWTSLERTLFDAPAGFGEAWADGEIHVAYGDLEDALTELGSLPARPPSLLRRPRPPTEVADPGDDFHRLILDRKLHRACAYFKSADDSLDAAQEQQIAHTLGKLDLRPGQRLFDLDPGAGHLLFAAAERYGVQGVCFVPGEAQAAVIRNMARARRLPVVPHTEPIDEVFERVVSPSPARSLAEITARLAPGGVAVIHREGHDGLDRAGLKLVDLESLRRHYVLTAQRWRKNFLAHREAIRLRFGLDEPGLRRWEIRLADLAARSRNGSLELVQMVVTAGVVDDYPLAREPAREAPVVRKGIMM